MMIGIDGNEANVENRVGIGEYAFELLQQFKRNKISNIKYQIYLKNKPLGSLPEENEMWSYRIIKPAKLWTQFGLPFDLYVHKPRPDVFFTPTHYAPRFSPVPTTISIMDLSFIHFPELFKKSDLYQLKNWTAYSAKNAKKIFTISQASKDDIIKIYKVPETKVIVTYPGIKSKVINPKPEINSKLKMQNSKLLQEKYGIKGSYILFVGTLQPRKNIARLIESFGHICHPEFISGSRSKKRDSSPAFGKAQNDIQLIIVGKKGWLYEEILAAPKKLNIEDRVKFLEFVPDEDLNILYQHALCFVLPSLYEGFGLPVLEAMKNGCPVATSNISSLPEVGGDAALYFDPTNIDDIADKINLLICNEKLRKELTEKGYRQLKKFNWETTAKKTLEELENIARDK